MVVSPIILLGNGPLFAEHADTQEVIEQICACEGFPIRVSQICRYAGCVRADLLFFSFGGKDQHAWHFSTCGHHHSPGLISGFSGEKKKSQNKNFDDHITTI